MDPPKKKRPAKSDDTELDRVKPRLSNSRPQDEEERHQGSVPELDVQMGSPETQESSDVEFAVPSYPESELVPDMFSNRVHVELDKKVLRLYPWMEDDEKDENSIYSRITLLRSLVRDYYGQLHQKPTDRTDPIRILRKHPWVIPVLNECWRKGSFRTIRLLSEYTVSGDASDLNMTIFSFCLTFFAFRDSTKYRIRPHPSLIYRCVGTLHPLGASLTIFIVVERSWDRKFEGPAADVLLHTISTYLTKEPSGSVMCSPIVNSSGTGKSRMVDELSKRVITIPMCLRGYDTNGSVIQNFPFQHAYVFPCCRIPSP